MKKSLLGRMACVVLAAALCVPAFATTGQAPPGAFANAPSKVEGVITGSAKSPAGKADTFNPALASDGKAIASASKSPMIPTLWRPSSPGDSKLLNAALGKGEGLGLVKDPPQVAMKFDQNKAGRAQLHTTETLLGEPPGAAVLI